MRPIIYFNQKSLIILLTSLKFFLTNFTGIFSYGVFQLKTSKIIYCNN